MDRNIWRKDGVLIPLPVAANTVIYAGHIVCTNADGFAVLAAADSTQTTMGIADEMVDNSNGTNGDVMVLVRRCASFCLANNTASPLTQSGVGKDCYVIDSVTVGNGAYTPPAEENDPLIPTNQVVGKVLEVTLDGVWVYIS